MDLIRTYCEIAFFKVAERWLSNSSDTSHPFDDENSFVLDEDSFIDEARASHPELSDDQSALIYRLGLDEWSRFGLTEADKGGNIMRVIAYLANLLLDEKNGEPIVRFRHLLRWREVTQLLGEDFLTCSFLAYLDRASSEDKRSFVWPSVIHNDNPDLNYIFRTKRLCELHSHLMASTNVFEISWVSLMNHISRQDKAFLRLASKHNPSRSKSLAEEVYDAVKMAARIRWDLYRTMTEHLSGDPFVFESEYMSLVDLDSATALERQAFSDKWIPDYIIQSHGSPMSIYAGERYFLYEVLKRIYSTNNQDITIALYRYLLAKGMLRKYMVQINNNIGFSNFQRFQDIKMDFMEKGYSSLPSSMPLWEAKHHNHTDIFESRIVPASSKQEYLRKVKILHKFESDGNDLEALDLRKILSNKEWMLIFHFLKRRSASERMPMRNFSVRNKNRSWGVALADIGKLMKAENLDMAIDAASSELACRPEVFSQTFRFLRYHGFDATFHAGEDFYDLADGLRAIDEAIFLLKMRSGDRIGHALALGIDAEKYYRTRHNTAALPKQWMLDNAVWLLMKSKILGVSMDSNTEWWLKDTYTHLIREIGYRDALYHDKNTSPSISDYWESMALRGDDPAMYGPEGEQRESFAPSADKWEHYSLLDSEYTQLIRDHNKNAIRIFQRYHDSDEIRTKGEKVKAFRLPKGYCSLITHMQDAMIKYISKIQICIECCPSSNVRIGRLDRFENHPIFRFFPIGDSTMRHHLSVTVNTDDLGVFATSLPNEFSLLALALLKIRNTDGSHRYSNKEVYEWIEKVIDNSKKYTFVTKSEEL